MNRLLFGTSDGSLSCHTCCDTGPRFKRSHPKNQITLITFYDKPVELWAYSNLYMCKSNVQNDRVSKSRLSTVTLGCSTLTRGHGTHLFIIPQ